MRDGRILSVVKPKKYGVSVTDACIDWPTTEQLLAGLHAQMKQVVDAPVAEGALA
jgi:phospho-2-dehydro-3-deoxyheptonate aldolase